jgi:hypothetical protein
MYSRDSAYDRNKGPVIQFNKVSFNQIVYLLVALMCVIAVNFIACTSTSVVEQPVAPNDQQPASSSAQNNASQIPAISITQTPVLPSTLITTPTPTDSAPSQSPQPDEKTPSPTSQANIVNPPAAEDLIRTEACKMTLTIEDVGAGWLKGNAVPASKGEVTSSCGVHYYKGTSFSPVIQNTTAVYRSVAYAERAYAKEAAKQATMTHPAYGNECFLNDSVAINKILVFRKINVVVWVWLQQDKKGDIEHYAAIIDQKIAR